MPATTAILLVHCADRPGLVAAISRFLHEHGGNIVYLDQHVDTDQGWFFLRIEWELDGFAIEREAIAARFGQEVAEPLKLSWRLHFSDVRPRMAVFVSKLTHCLYDILARVACGEWAVEVPLIVSNHADASPIASQFGIAYHEFAIDPASKADQEQREIAMLREHQIDFVVLARYMQVLSPAFVAAFPNRVINIHHSFLPAFAGARPYHSAHRRGVKLIGATSHFVTDDLDEGPIIAQETVAVSHVDSIDDMVRKGRDLEKIVLARAIWHHLQHKILVCGNRTVVFS